jgi:hypothetical protein
LIPGFLVFGARSRIVGCATSITHVVRVVGCAFALRATGSLDGAIASTRARRSPRRLVGRDSMVIALTGDIAAGVVATTKVSDERETVWLDFYSGSIGRVRSTLR